MLFDSDAHRDIYLVFMNASFTGDAWLKNGFKHVYSIERQALGWICTDPSKSDMHTYILPARFESDVIGEFKRLNPHFTIIRLRVKPHAHSVFPRIGLLSCVSAMQYMLGVYWPFVVTPYQLYNKMRKKLPLHLEVIEWHDTKSTQRKERHAQQL